MASTVKTISTPGTTNWICPPGVTSIQVELWGGGGSGGPATGTASGAGGGAGGQYAIKQVTVTPGTTYAVSVAASKTAATSAVGNGNDTTFASTTVVAKGGAGGAQATAATSTGGVGSTTGGVGDTVFAGGSGGNGVSSTQSGGGGGGAGSSGIGNSGSGATAGLAKANNGGAGGTGVSVANANNPGSIYGGGGSGGLSSTATDRAGGAGAQGLAVLTYTTPLFQNLTDNWASSSLNPNLWFGQFGNAPSFTGGQLKLTTTANSSNYQGFDSLEIYDLTGSYTFVQVVDAGNQALAGLENFSVQLLIDGSNNIMWYINNGSIMARTKVAGVSAGHNSTTYNPAVHKWLKIRESGGTTFWDYSTDSVNWTNLYSVANPIAVTALKQEFSFGDFNTTEAASTATYGFFNLLPPIAKDIQNGNNTLGANIQQAVTRGAYW